MTALEKWKNDFKEFISELSMPRDDYKGIMEYINEVPNETRWIPVSERLPENNGTYLVWDKYGYQISDFNAEEQTFGFLTECNFDYETGEVYPPCWVEHDTVIAWMPLPKPYKAESEGNDGSI